MKGSCMGDCSYHLSIWRERPFGWKDGFEIASDFCLRIPRSAYATTKRFCRKKNLSASLQILCLVILSVVTFPIVIIGLFFAYLSTTRTKIAPISSQQVGSVFRVYEKADANEKIRLAHAIVQGIDQFLAHEQEGEPACEGEHSSSCFGKLTGREYLYLTREYFRESGENLRLQKVLLEDYVPLKVTQATSDLELEFVQNPLQKQEIFSKYCLWTRLSQECESLVRKQLKPFGSLKATRESV